MAAKARLRLDGADPINKGLLGFWPMREGGGQIWRDISPNRWDARPGTAPTHRATPEIGTVGSFNGSTQYLTTAAPSNPGTTGAHSVVAWVRPNFSSASNTLGNIIIRGIAGTTGQRLVWVSAADGWYSDNTSGGAGAAFKTAAATPAFSAGEWHLLEFTYNGGGQFYWDGVPVATTGPLFGTWPNANLADTPFYIGRDISASQYWNGELGPIRQYTRPITYDERRRILRDPWAGTLRTRRRVLATTGTPHTATPGAGAETYAGQGATVKAGATLLPGAGAETYAGKQAAVTAGATVAVGAGTETYQGLGAGVTQPATVAVGAGLVEVLGLQAALGSGLSGRVVRRGRYRTWDDVPTELAPVVSLAENYADELAVQRAVDDALARFAAMKAKTSIARRERLVGDLKRAIVAAVEEAAEADDEDALIALL